MWHFEENSQNFSMFLGDENGYSTGMMHQGAREVPTSYLHNVGWSPSSNSPWEFEICDEPNKWAESQAYSQSQTQDQGMWISPQLKKALDELEKTVNKRFSNSPTPLSSMEHYMGEARTPNWWSQEVEFNVSGGAAITTLELDFDLSMPWLAPSIPKMTIAMPLEEEESIMELPSSEPEEKQVENEEWQPIFTSDMEELGNHESPTTSPPSQPKEGITMESFGIHIEMVMHLCIEDPRPAWGVFMCSATEGYM